MEMIMPTLKELNAQLDALYATVNDEHEDTPQILAEQERLFAAIAHAEAASLSTLSAKQLVEHFQKRAPGQHLAKGLSKAALIAKIEALPPLAPTPEPEPAAKAEVFTVSGYAKAKGLDARELRKSLRSAGLKAPYSLDQVEKVIGGKK
jgi:hypothetical protein